MVGWNSSDYRHSGIGTKLFEKIEEIARENNCELIYFTSKSDNVGAHAFIKDYGWYDMNAEKARENNCELIYFFIKELL